MSQLICFFLSSKKRGGGELILGSFSVFLFFLASPVTPSFYWMSLTLEMLIKIVVSSSSSLLKDIHLLPREILTWMNALNFMFSRALACLKLVSTARGRYTVDGKLDMGFAT